MSDTYDLAFGQNTPYAHAVRLLSRYANSGGIVLDIGAGHGPLGEAVDAAGYTYVGIDIDKDGLSHIASRGFESHWVDLADFDSVVSRIRDIADSRQVSAILALDIIEHIAESAGFVAKLMELAIELNRPPLIVSVPNVGHFDIAAKLLTGRWETTPSGLLDRTHLAFYTNDSLTEVMNDHGWVELGRDDFALYESDQHFPSLLPGLASGSSLSSYLRRLREKADQYGSINQFVRVYSAGSVTRRSTPSEQAPGVSVIMRTQGRRLDLLAEALLSLAGQTSADFEVLLMVHSLDPDSEPAVRRTVGDFTPGFSDRVRIIEVNGGDRARPLNVGLRAAKGDYIAFLDDDDLVTSDWIEVFLEGGRRHPGAVVRAVTADQTVRKISTSPGYAVESGPVVDRARISFSMVRHLETNRTPICSFAVPRVALLTYDLTFDETLRVLEDWHFLIRVALVCGVYDMKTVTSIYRRWHDEEASWHSIDRGVWAATRTAIQIELDSQPVLLPVGSVSAISDIIERAHRGTDVATSGELKKVRKELTAANRRIKALESSTSWRVTRPLRAATRVLRRGP